jgi:hypothetical protein
MVACTMHREIPIACMLAVGPRIRFKWEASRREVNLEVRVGPAGLPHNHQHLKIAYRGGM